MAAGSPIKYRLGTPKKNGVYAVRVPITHNFDSVADLSGVNTSLGCDMFLIYYEGRWCYLHSDQYYRGEVWGYLGPLPRVNEKHYKAALAKLSKNKRPKKASKKKVF